MAELNRHYRAKAKKSKLFLFSRKSSKPFGFTLIELMITVAIVGILASVAYPSYVGFVTSSNRTEGQRELLRFANLQEQYFVDYRTYATSLTALGKSTAAINTENKHYRIKVQSGADADGFILKATARNAQLANDSDCSPLRIDQVGVKTPTGCWD